MPQVSEIGYAEVTDFGLMRIQCRFRPYTPCKNLGKYPLGEVDGSNENFWLSQERKSTFLHCCIKLIGFAILTNMLGGVAVLRLPFYFEALVSVFKKRSWADSCLWEVLIYYHWKLNTPHALFMQCNYKRLGHFRFKFYFWGATKTGSCVSLHDGVHDIRIVSAAQLFRWSVSSPRQNNGERWSFCSKISLLLAWDSHYMFRNFLFSTSRQVLHVMSVQREAKQTLRVATFNVLAPCYNWLR